MHDTLTFEQKAFDDFIKAFKEKKFGTQRLGQAFYNHFNLHKLEDQTRLQNIYSKDGKHAVNWIASKQLNLPKTSILCELSTPEIIRVFNEKESLGNHPDWPHIPSTLTDQNHDSTHPSAGF